MPARRKTAGVFFARFWPDVRLRKSSTVPAGTALEASPNDRIWPWPPASPPPCAAASVADYRDTSEIISSFYMREFVQKELDAALRQAKALLSKHRAALDEAARLLLSKRRITGAEVASMIEAFAPEPSPEEVR
jgi:hypothetical protein